MLLAAAAALLIGASPAGTAPWQALEPGLELAVLEGPEAPAGDRKITVLRIDPRRFDLRLLNASAPGQGGAPRTARAWAASAGAVAAINASMYQGDNLTSVGLMRTRAYVNHRRLSKDRSVLAFDPADRALPPVRLVDRDCEDLEPVAARYGTLVQSIRMISCDRKNVWAPSDRRFSAAAIGVDGAGRVLFVHARTAWPVHALVEALLALPLDLRQAMYVEGGPEAQLYVKAAGRELELVGGFDRPLISVENVEAWPVPNVIAVLRKAR
jgi:hypothetical protein